jgi:1,4-alpha-glucan branching enzyme
VPPPKPIPSVAASTAAAVAVSSEAAKPAAKPAEPEAKAASKAKRNILFRLTGHTAAKEVSIIGDFNNWKRQALKKDAKGWTISVPLAPGRYEYAYVLDGKKYRDPNNKQSANNGRVSVLTVKPLAKP